MGFSELEFLKEDLGLDWDSDKLCLYGSVSDYPVFVTDDFQNRKNRRSKIYLAEV